MPYINFALGQNIIKTAEKSGAPRFTSKNVAGLISYSIAKLEPRVIARFAAPGFEVEVGSLFALTMYADEDNRNDLGVEQVTLQIAEDAVKSHASARAFVDALISQFTLGAWTRHIPAHCPQVRGRSTYLTVAGDVDEMNSCPLDPRYRVPEEDWLVLMKEGQRYEWSGAGVLAALSLKYSEQGGKITYDIWLEFQDEVIGIRRMKEKLAAQLAEGEAAGRNSLKKHEARVKKREELIQVLEQNAIRRGDGLQGH